MFREIGVPELLIILAIVVVLFGASRVSQIGGAIGRGIREFRHELKGPETEEGSAPQQQSSQMSQEEPKQAPAAPVPPASGDRTWFQH